MTEPQSAATPFGPGYGAQATTQLAGFWRRFVAYAIDWIVLGIVSGIIEAIMAVAFGPAGDTPGAAGRAGGVTIILGLAYFGFLWSRDGQTIGFRAVGLRLVGAEGQPITFVAAMLRYLLIYLSFAICLVPAIVSGFMVGMGERKQAIHDVIVHTLVVRA